ncbi:MAG TPA: DUF3618 domain-containing protein [Pyrinomonadaceae bacterium]|nr:DUF3618 domain-containing protein [Pyrinomonadaceae bacterium]
MDEATNQVTAAADSDENPEQLRSEIEDTRAVMSQTINEIQERLSPDHLMGQVKETVRDATIGKVERVVDRVGETISEVTEPAREVAGLAGNAIKEVGTTVADKMWKNPIPVALIGLGVGMILVRNFSGRSYGSTSSSGTSLPNRRSNYELGDVGQVPRTQTTSGTSTLNQVKETASGLASRSTDALSNLGTKARNSASVVGTRFGEVLRENPLAVGAVAIAAGTAVGLVLPSTQFESEYIGETGGKLVESVEDVARDALGKVKDAAKQMTPGQEGQQGQQGQQPRA